MANKAEFELVFKARDDGTLVLAEKRLVSAGKAAKNLGNAQRSAAEGATSHNTALNGGVTSANNSGRANSKLLQTLGGSNSGLVAAYATLATNAFAVSAAFSALSSAAKAEQVLRGLEEQGARTGLTLSITAKNMREITGDAISMADSMQSAAQMTAAGFNTSTMERLTAVATNAAAALGRNIPDAMDRIVKGTTKLEPELLDELGIMTKLDEATRLYATQIGKAPAALSRFEKQQAFVNAVAAEGERKFNGLSDTMGNLKAYDSLAAAFTDLTNSVLSFFNGALLPVANFLSNNTVALFGVLAIFAGTIRNMLLPELAKMAENSRKAATAAKELTAAKKQSAITIADEAKATAIANATSAREFTIHAKAPKIFKARAEAIKAGSRATEDFEAATASLTKSIKTYDDNIKQNRTKSTEVAAKREIIAELTKQLQVIKDLQAADIAATDAAVENAKSVQRAKALASKAELNQAKQEGISAVVGAVSSGDTVGTFEAISKGVSDYKDKLEEASSEGGGMFASIKAGGAAAVTSFKSVYATVKSSTGATVGLKAGLMGVSLGVRAVGVAVTNMLPLIGQVIFVAGLLWSAVKWVYEYTRPAGTEALNKALEDQEERYATTAAAAANLERVGMKTASAQVDSLTAVSNKVNEIADGYEAIKLAQANIGKTDKERAKEIPNPLENIKLSKDLRSSEAYKALENLTQLNFKELTDSIYLSVSATKALSDASVSTADKQKLLEVILKDTQKAFGSAGSNSKMLADNYTALDKSVEEFNRSAVASTPFDNIVRDLTQTTASIYDLQSSMYSGALSAKSFGIQLAAVGTRAAGLLDIQIQTKLNAFKDAQAEVTKLNLEIEKGTAARGSTEKLKTLTASLEADAITLGVALQKNFVIKQNEFAVLQEQLRTNAALISQEKARADKTARMLDDSKLSARLQDASAEKQAALAVSALDAQIKAAKNAKKQAEDEYQKIVDKRIILEKTEQDQIAAKKEAANLDAEATKNQLKGLKSIKQFNDEQIASAILDRQLRAKTAEEGDAQIAKSFESANKAIRKLQDTKFFSGLFEEISDVKVNVNTAEADKALNKTRAELASVRAAEMIASAERYAKIAQITGLEAEKYVAQAGLLTEAEKISRDLRYDNKLVNEYLDIQLKLIESINSLDLERLKTGKTILNSYDKQLQTKQLELKLEIESIKNSKKTERNTLETEKGNKQRLLNQKDLSAEVKAALNFDIAAINAKIIGLKTEETVLTNVASVKSAIQMVEAASIDVYKEGLEIQQKALEVIQRRYDLQEKLLDQSSELSSLRAETGAAQTGIPVGERAKKALEVQAAEEAYQLAQNQLELKLKGIQLEYALLEAQRLATLYEFEIRSKLIEMQKSEILEEARKAKDTPEGAALTTRANEIGVMLDQFNATTSDLRKQTYKDLIPMAEQIERRSVEILGARAAKIRAEFNNLGRPTTDASVYMQAINDFQTIIKAQERMVTSETGKLSTPVISDAQKAAEAQVTQTQELIKTISTKFPDLIAEMEKLRDAFLPLVGAFKSKLPPVTVKAEDIAKPLAAATAKQASTTKPSVTKPGATITGKEEPEIGVTSNVSTISLDTTTPLKTNLLEINDLVQKVDLGVQKTKVSFGTYWNYAIQASQPLLKTLKDLGPSGEASAAAIQGIQQIGLVAINFSKSSSQSFEEYSKQTEESNKKLVAMGQKAQEVGTEGQFAARKLGEGFAVAASVIGTVMSILDASTKAKTAGIDKEIAAEQKRDGKSSASVEKIKALEAKKEAIAKKAFNTNKKLSIAQAVMSTAAGIANALGRPGDPVTNAIMAGIIGAMGAAQIAVIASTSYESTSASSAPSTPSTLSIGKRSDTVDLARGPSASAGGEVGFIRGTAGTGSNASNYRTVGSAYGGELMRGYGNRGFVVGEKGPEVITPETPISVTPANDTQGSAPVNATFNIQALDSSDVQRILVEQKGNIITMLRQAANASGKTFMEDVNTNVYTRPNIGKL